jgi:hypothetical protein
MSAASIAGLWQTSSAASAAAQLALLGALPGGLSGRTSVLPNATTPLTGVCLIYCYRVPNLLLTAGAAAGAAECKDQCAAQCYDASYRCVPNLLLRSA